jgi:hypothetical protein
MWTADGADLAEPASASDDVDALVLTLLLEA